jgi:hypothetical protein
MGVELAVVDGHGNPKKSGQNIGIVTTEQA